MSESPRPPWIAEKLLCLIPNAEVRRLVRQDLNEEYQRVIVPALGNGRARLWYWRLALVSIVDTWSSRLRHAKVNGPGPDRNRSPGRVPLVDEFARDVRLALRMLRREPVFSLTVAGTMLLGIGATTAFASVLTGVLLRPLPFPDSQYIVRLARSSDGVPSGFGVVGFPDMRDWRARSTLMRDIAGWTGTGMTLSPDGRDPERVRVAQVTDGFDAVLGLVPEVGRFFHPSEFLTGSEPVVLLTHRFWVNRFGRNPNVVGTLLVLDRVPHRVVGVLPRMEFRYPEGYQLWRPLIIPGDSWRMMRGASWLTAIGRVRATANLPTAQQELSSIQRQLVEEYPRPQEGQNAVTLTPLKSTIVASVRPVLLMMTATVGLVLTIACANVAVLVLSRANRRRQELVVRRVLGGSRSRIVRQMLTETLVLAFLGGGVGMLLAPSLIDAVVALYPGGLPRAAEIRVDAWILVAATGAILGAAVLGALLPAFRISRMDTVSQLTNRGGSPVLAQVRLRTTLAVTQIGFSTLLGIGAMVFLETFANLRNQDPGFAAHDLLTFRITLPDAAYEDDRQVTQFYESLLGELTGIPGVTRASAVNFLPFTSGEWGGGYAVPARAPGQNEDAMVRISWPGYYEVLGIDVVRGRAFQVSDRQDTPRVALLNEVAAARTFGRDDPIGEYITFEGDRWQIIGVVAAVRHHALRDPPAPEIHVPAPQFPRGDMTVVIRSSRDMASLVSDARAVMRRLDPNIPLIGVATAEELLDRILAPDRFRALLLSGLGGVALTLALVGIYGVMSYSVGQRLHELGIRLALGEQRGSLIGRVLLSAGRVIAVGCALGVVAAVWIGQGAERFLYGVSASDPVVLCAVPLTLMLAGLASALPPALRASRASPLAVLNSE